MKLGLPILAILLALGGLAWFRARQKPPSQRTFGSTDEFVQFLANEAVKDAWQQNQTRLDYTVESIKTVDKILGGVHDQYVKNHSSVSVKGLGAAYGAYIGEVIRRNEPGAYWLRDDALGEKSYPIVWGPGPGHSYPMGWCSRRIENGDEDNVWIKYIAIKEGYARTHASTASRH